MATHVEKARDNFLAGYNCAQAVACAFAEEMGMTVDQAARLASGFGGGFGRMREVCGAVSGMFMVLGLLSGSAEVPCQEEKAALYAAVQTLAARFREKNGTILCRELLRNIETTSGGVPEVRSAAYYSGRPCAAIIASAADLLEAYLTESKK